MSILFSPMTSNVHDALVKGAESLLSEDHPELGQLVERVLGDPERHFPHKVYSIQLEDILEGGGLRAAHLIGWRFIVPFDDTLMAAVQLASNADESELAFSEINMGPYVMSTLSFLLNLRDSEFEHSDMPYTVALLNITSLYAVAIWLQTPEGEHDVVIPIPPTHIRSLEAGRPYTGDEFNERLQGPAHETLTHPANNP